MRSLFAGLFALGLVACGQGAQDAQAQDGNWTQDELEELVHAYIVNNPEVIEEALIELQRRARQREQSSLFENVENSSAALFEDPRDPVAGPDDAAVTIVEFFDYKCGFCRRSHEWVTDVLDEHGDQVRFVFKEFPVLGPESVEASRAALAVWRTQPERYLAFHDAMMSSSGPLPSARIDDLAEDSGVNVETMRTEMESEAVSDHIAEIRALAQNIGITGTPFFIVGDAVIPGADIAGLERALGEALGG